MPAPSVAASQPGGGAGPGAVAGEGRRPGAERTAGVILHMTAGVRGPSPRRRAGERGRLNARDPSETAAGRAAMAPEPNGVKGGA